MRRRIVGKVFPHENYRMTHFPNSTSRGSDAVKNQRKEESRSAQTGQLRKALHCCGASGHQCPSF